MTTDILRDFMLGRLNGRERARVRDRLRVDPRLRGVLRRLRNTTVRLRTRVGRVDQQLPAEWLALIERVDSRASGPAPTWLGSSPNQNDERRVTWV